MTSTGPGPQGRWAGNTLAEFERDLADNLCYQRGTTAESASALDAYWMPTGCLLDAGGDGP